MNERWLVEDLILVGLLKVVQQGATLPYLIYRVSGISPGAPAELRISEDLRPLALAIEAGSLATAQAGTQVTGVAIDPQTVGIAWSGPIALPPPPPSS